MMYGFYEYAQQNHIEIFRLSPHSTHLIQPLYVECFQPFNHYYKNLRYGLEEPFFPWEN